jgi:hypothetical protein
MVIVSTSESSQCRAVAVPCAWKARRRGCAGDNRGGSVVLQSSVQHMRIAMGAAGVDSPPQRIQDIPNHAAPRALPQGMSRPGGAGAAASGEGLRRTRRGLWCE